MKYTPSKIVEENLFYTIPIYQRLFEWNTDNIITLLEDLKKEYIVTEGQGDYYIGLLTSTKNNELVDGQQRFTVMILLGCVLQNHCELWKKFLAVDNRIRIDFTSRPLDNSYLRALIDSSAIDENKGFKNLKMLNGIKQIRNFMDCMQPDDYSNFAEYVYRHLCFFITKLPEGYSPRDLNKYFERMNTTGKNLEQHEILKVKLLSNLDENVDKYMLLWNKLADVDTKLIRRKQDEDVAFAKRQAIQSDISTIISNGLINGIRDDEYNEAKSIGDIELSTTVPKNDRELNRDSRCALSFPYLLLQVLYRMLDRKIHCSINEFFKPNNLLSLFEEYLPFNGTGVNKGEIKCFMEMLVRARLALDICFVRPTEYGYSLDLNLNEDSIIHDNLLMLQSMIYVSSSNYTNYRWFNWLMDEVDVHGIPNPEALYKSMMSKINEEFTLPPYEELTYKGDNRFWFWKLDLYIWQHRNQLFEKGSQEMNIVENYVFKRNRSIEHIAPQTPQSNSQVKWNDTVEDELLRDSFGNLVMISQGLNSSLSNESYEVKREHVRSYCNGSKSGSIESLKLLIVHNDYPNGWNKDTIEEHGKKMYSWLLDSFNENQ